jgi:hypothetical protein
VILLLDLKQMDLLLVEPTANPTANHGGWIKGIIHPWIHGLPYDAKLATYFYGGFTLNNLL